MLAIRMDGSREAVMRSRPLSSLAANLDGSMLCVIMSLLPLMSSPYRDLVSLLLNLLSSSLTERLKKLACFSLYFHP